MNKILSLILTTLLASPVFAVPRPGGIYENSVDNLVFTGQRKVIRGKFSKKAQVKFITKEGQEIDFQVTKIRKKNGVTRLNYIVPTINIDDEFGNSLTEDTKDLYIVTGELEVVDDRLLSNRQLFDMTILIRPDSLVDTASISSTVNGETDSIYHLPRVGL